MVDISNGTRRVSYCLLSPPSAMTLLMPVVPRTQFANCYTGLHVSKLEGQDKGKKKLRPIKW